MTPSVRPLPIIRQRASQRVCYRIHRQGNTNSDTGIDRWQTEHLGIVKKNEYVGYGTNYKSNRSIRVGVAAIGYADGYPRSSVNGTSILVGNKKCKFDGVDIIRISPPFKIPLKKSGTSKDISKTVKFIISKDSNYIHGQIFTVAGGE